MNIYIHVLCVGGGGAYNDREYTYTWVEAGWDDIVQLWSVAECAEL